MEAIICTRFVRGVCFLIPKLNGNGYVKSPFGGHHSNKHHKEFRFRFNYDMVDIDGHCYVDMEDENDIDRLKQFLIERFPRITGFKEVDRIDFYNIICSNEGWQEKIKNE